LDKTNVAKENNFGSSFEKRRELIEFPNLGGTFNPFNILLRTLPSIQASSRWTAYKFENANLSRIGSNHTNRSSTFNKIHQESAQNFSDSNRA
jgi:hypothetical protein